MNCLFEYSDKTESFLLNNFNENQTHFINHKEINKIICEYPDLYVITKNNKFYRVDLKEGKLIFLDENVISATVIFATCNYLTQDHVVLNRKKLNNLPQLEQDDKFINFVTPGQLTCCFLLTEKGNVFIYGVNTYGIFGCKTIKNNNEITSFVKHTELEEKITSKIVDIKCGYSFCVIRCENGECYGSGYNYYVNMGITTKDELSGFTLLKDKVKQYGCGHFSSVFLTFDGDIYVCGKQDNGQFGTEFPLNGGLGVPLTKLKLNGIKM
ncbi:hypothetical protein ABK040_003608 [Willaertia magna]